MFNADPQYIDAMSGISKEGTGNNFSVIVSWSHIVGQFSSLVKVYSAV